MPKPWPADTRVKPKPSTKGPPPPQAKMRAPEGVVRQVRSDHRMLIRWDNGFMELLSADEAERDLEPL